MRQRPSSRLLVVDAQSRVLLFQFEHKRGVLSGRRFWATPGGGVESGENFEEAACREMLEETGVRLENPGPEVARRVRTFRWIDGGLVEADERFFLVRVTVPLQIPNERWTDLEREFVVGSGWWSRADLISTDEIVFPEDLAEILIEAEVS
jgi:8-oxo-dGTP pyrophosphatase MutT (NUDIX family)